MKWQGIPGYLEELHYVEEKGSDENCKDKEKFNDDRTYNSRDSATCSFFARDV